MKKRIVHAVVGIALLALVAGGLVLRGQRGASGEAVQSVGGRSLSITGVGRVPYYLQNDPGWAGETLGGTGGTIGAAGCTVSCVAMGVSALGHPMDPGEVCAALKREGGFTGSGQVIWSAVGEITNGAVRIELPSPRHAVIDDELSEGRPVIAKIMLWETVPHWVLIVGKDEREYMVMDPLNRDRSLVRLSDRAAAIHAIRVFRRR